MQTVGTSYLAHLLQISSHLGGCQLKIWVCLRNTTKSQIAVFRDPHSSHADNRWCAMKWTKHPESEADETPDQFSGFFFFQASFSRPWRKIPSSSIIFHSSVGARPQHETGLFPCLTGVAQSGTNPTCILGSRRQSPQLFHRYSSLICILIITAV